MTTLFIELLRSKSSRWLLLSHWHLSSPRLYSLLRRHIPNPPISNSFARPLEAVIFFPLWHSDFSSNVSLSKKPFMAMIITCWRQTFLCNYLNLLRILLTTFVYLIFIYFITLTIIWNYHSIIVLMVYNLSLQLNGKLLMSSNSLVYNI